MKFFSGLLVGVILCLLVLNVYKHFAAVPNVLPADGVLPNNVQYFGKLIDGYLEGPGQLIGADGSRTEGFFKKGLLHGEVEIWDVSGAYLKVNFEDGLMNGIGEIEYPDGGTYQGQFKDNLIHGHGALRYGNGDFYVGQFEKAKMEGVGLLTQTRGDRFQGTFVDDEISEGIFMDARGNHYEGEFKSWMFHGEGVYTTEQGDVYKGQFEEGVLMGEGEHILHDGAHYVGGFVHWLYDGKGEFVRENGDVYQGEFRDGLYHGQGKLTLNEERNGHSVVEGEWERGYLKDDPRFKRADRREQIETLLYQQNHLIDQQLAAIPDNNPNRSELFFLGMAGYGSQDVFLKEIRFIEEVFGKEELAAQRIAKLVNHYDTVDELPLATSTSLEKTIQGLESKMDVENDILFLYMTSHGSEDHKFSIKLRGVKLPDISAEAIASILNKSAIRWKVVMISACYSGGYIPHLESDNTMIMVSSRHDRMAYGCGDDSEMTYFGEAYFKETLPNVDSFVSAFEQAKSIVERREREEEIDEDKRSVPQIYIGKNIEEKLVEWRAESM